MNTHRTLVRGAAAAAVLAAVSLAGAPAVAADGPGAGTATDAASGDTAVQVAALVQPSVVYETVTWSGYVYDRYNQQYLRDKPFTVTMQCTGFVVNPDGYVATAGHCVDPDGGEEALRQQAADWALANYYDLGGVLSADDVVGDYRVDILGDGNQVLHNRATRTVDVSWGASVSGVDVQKRKPARVLDFQEYDEGDGALLKVDETDLNAIELADTSGVEISSDVTAIGYPAIIDSFTDPDLTPTFDAGNVSSIKTVSGGLLSVFQLSADLSGGMSGGPTVDAEGRVIGVIGAHFVGEPFNYAVPAERIEELMAGAGVENVVSDTTETYRDGIRAYFEGDRDAAVSDLEAVLDEQPANGLAETYLDKARDLPAPAASSSDDSTSWTLWAAVAGGVVVAIGGGLTVLVAVLRRARRPRPDRSVAAYPAPAAPTPVTTAVPTQPAPAGAPAPAGFAPASTVPPGAPTGVATMTAVHCASCGRGLDVSSNFCPGCGARSTPTA